MKKAGYIAIVGRPNVGKSTLMNRILRQKLSITCRKPQTTRHQIVGVKTEGDVQAIYVDTPGIHNMNEKAINRFMNKAATSVLSDVDVVIFIVEAMKWTDLETSIIKKFEHLEIPVILVINKVDQVKPKANVLPFLEKVSKRYAFQTVVPLSAKNGQQVDTLESIVADLLPENEFIYDEDQVTDRTERFLVSEIIREKLMRSLGEEVPYQLTVQIDQFSHDEHKKIIDISATILVERPSQKSMIIGGKGQKLKQIGMDARKDIEAMLDSKVYLQLWVKVKEGWSDSDHALRSLGYE